VRLSSDFWAALLFTNLGAQKVRRTEQKCAERSLDYSTGDVPRYRRHNRLPIETRRLAIIWINMPIIGAIVGIFYFFGNARD
jgi:hypothetical protein